MITCFALVKLDAAPQMAAPPSGKPETNLRMNISCSSVQIYQGAVMHYWGLVSILQKNQAVNL